MIEQKAYDTTLMITAGALCEIGAVDTRFEN
jgi:hypothetical protein